MRTGFRRCPYGRLGQMKSNLFMVFTALSLLVNIGAAYIWCQWFLQTYVVHDQIRKFGEEVQGQISATGFHVVYADKDYSIARKDDGAWFFHSRSADEVVAFAAMKEKDNNMGTAHNRMQYLLSAHKFFAGWKRGSDMCEDVVLQYNDTCKFTDRQGVGEMMSECRDDRLFWTDRATLDAEGGTPSKAGTGALR